MLHLKLRGKFYITSNDDAKVLGQITGYKVIEKSTGRLEAAFSAEALDKVIGIMKSCEISYLITISGEEQAKMEFLGDRYNEYLSYFDDAKIIPFEGEKSKSISSPGRITVDTEEKRVVLEYLTRLCDGKDPMTGEYTNSIRLNDAKIIRMFYRIKEYTEHLA